MKLENYESGAASHAGSHLLDTLQLFHFAIDQHHPRPLLVRITSESFLKSFSELPGIRAAHQGSQLGGMLVWEGLQWRWPHGRRSGRVLP